MRRGLKYSLTLHTAVILLAIFGLPHFQDDVVMMSAPIPVEIVSADQVSSAPQREHKPAPTPPKPEPPKPQPVAKPPEPQPIPDLEPPPAPEPKKPEPKPQPKPEPPKPDDTPQPKPPEPKKPEPPKPVPPKPTPPKPTPPKPQTQQRPKPQQDDNQFKDLLSDLSSAETSESADEPQTKPDPAPAQRGVKDSPVEKSPNLSQLLNSSEMDAVRNQVMGCWLQPTGLPNSSDLVVEVKVVVNEDRTVRSAEVVDKGRMRSDNFYRTLGESAVRALYNPRCSPLQLPADKYDTWNTITFRFSPQEIY